MIMGRMAFDAILLEAGLEARVRITLDRGLRSIASIEPWDRSVGPPGASLPIVAPALWDIQHNGRGGVAFSDPNLTVDQVRSIVGTLPETGVGRFCPTLITASPEAMMHGVRTLAAACAMDPLVDAIIAGIHLEGPSISGVDGYRGAHPIEHVRDPDWSEFDRLQEARGGRIALVTLAPERDGAIEFIRRTKEAGVTIALGHTAADGPTIAAAVEAGATLSTHLGNGIATPLPRHPNPIWLQGGEDRLSASFIADLSHLDACTLRVLARAKGPDRTILVSDLGPLAGCRPGVYGPWEVRPDGRIVVAGTAYLAGANVDLVDCLGQFARVINDWDLSSVLATVTTNPARLLGRPIPRLEPGAPANLLLLDRGEDGRSFRPRGSLIEGQAHGRWAE